MTPVAFVQSPRKEPSDDYWCENATSMRLGVCGEAPMLGRVVLEDGAEVESDGRRFVIMQVIGFDAVVARDIESEEPVRLAVLDLKQSRASFAEPPQPHL